MGSASSRRADEETLPSPQPPVRAAAAYRRPAPPPAPPSSVRIPLTREPTADSELDADEVAPPPPETLTDLQEIQDLERTFDSLGIPLKVDDNANVKEVGGSRNEAETGENDETREESTSKCEVNVLPESVTAIPVKTSVRNDDKPFSQNVFMTTQTGIAIKKDNSIISGPQNSVYTPEIQLEQDWNYSQKEIEGFDVEKFRMANRKVITSAEGYSLQLTRNDKTMTTVHSLQFPSYDSTEEQLLAGIEEEFAS